MVESRPDDIPLGVPHLGVAIMGVLYLLGAMFYIKQIPEKYYP